MKINPTARTIKWTKTARVGTFFFLILGDQTPAKYAFLSLPLVFVAAASVYLLHNWWAFSLFVFVTRPHSNLFSLSLQVQDDFEDPHGHWLRRLYVSNQGLLLAPSGLLLSPLFPPLVCPELPSRERDSSQLDHVQRFPLPWYLQLFHWFKLAGDFQEGMASHPRGPWFFWGGESGDAQGFSTFVFSLLIKPHANGILPSCSSFKSTAGL